MQSESNDVDAAAILRQPRKGLSLIELTIVVLVIGILSSVGVTRLSTQLNRHSVDGVARLLLIDLTNAQQEALATSSTVTVAVTKSTHTYSITALRNNVATVVRSVMLSADPWKCSLSSLQVGTARTAATTVSITINGAGVFSNDLVFGLSCGSATASVAIEASSGRVLRE